MNKPNALKTELRDTETRLLTELRTLRRGARTSRASRPPQLTVGQRIADTVAANMGSWRFIIIQSAILVVWIILNVTAYIQQWDPYPFILLNLVMSLLASIQAPIIMMSQNRAGARDRLQAENDFKVNLKAEIEVRALTEKIDQLLHNQWARMMEIQQIQMEMLEEITARRER
jgi:uncharacterized membrane protein